MWKRVRSWLWTIFRRSRMEREMDAELRFHIDACVEDLVRAGVPRQEASRRARIEFGGIERAKEECRDASGLNFFDSLSRDIPYALRIMRKSRVFTVVAVLTLALGIGANTATYTLLDQALLRSLPVKEPNRLALLRYVGKGEGGASFTRNDDALYYSYPMYRDLRDRNSVFTNLIATAWAQVGIQWHNQPDLANAELVSGNYFEALGVQPALGRLFEQSDDVAPEASPLVVLSFDYWQRRFGLDPHVLSQGISINGHPFTIIGVAPPGFHSVVGGDAPAVFVPMKMKPEVTPGLNDLENRRSSWLNIIGRLKPGFTLREAQAGMDPLWHSIRAEELAQYGHHSAREEKEFLTNSHLFLVDGSKGVPMHGTVTTTLLVVMGLATLIALMVCTNVGSLLLVRSAARTREFSVRYALGATRSSVIQQLLSEGMLLGLAGGVAGILIAPQVAALLIRTIWTTSRQGTPFSTHLDWRILAFNFSLAIVASLLFSLAPALQFWRPDVTPALKQQAPVVTAGSLRLRRASVVAQIAISLLLLAGAGLFVRTLQRLKAQDVGFATDNLVTFAVEPRLAGYNSTEAAELYPRILENLRGLPGVRSEAATNDPELADNNFSNNITVAGYSPSENENMNVERAVVSADYFTTMSMPLLAGRGFTEGDREGTHNVAVVNEKFVRHFFGQPQNAVGHYFGLGAGNVKTDIEIVGVVRDAKHTRLRDKVDPTMFTPYLQDHPSGVMRFGLTFYVRTWQSPEGTETMIRQAILELDPRLVLDNFRTMQEQVDENVSNERVIAVLASSFGVLAALMAAIGIYGVLAYSTSQRTREIGIRIALGATRAAVMRMVMIEVLWLAGIGIIAGLGLSVLFGYAVRTQLFGISQNDPLTLALVSVLVLVVGFGSAALPALRAAKVDPMVALRYE